MLAPVLGILFLLGTFFRTPFGELTRALGLSIVLVLERTSRVRRTYPTWRLVPGCLGVAQRKRPFPPARNPWRYQPRGGDPDFNMMYALIAMAFVGSTCGGNIKLPIIPTSMGALGGAALFATGCLANSARGDLCRSMGMRVVALVEELWEIQADLRIIPKVAVVSSQILDKLLIFDRKHKVKDKLLTLVNKGYDQVVTARQQGMGIDDDGGDDRRGPRQRREGSEDLRRRRGDDDAGKRVTEDDRRERRRENDGYDDRHGQRREVSGRRDGHDDGRLDRGRDDQDYDTRRLYSRQEGDDKTDTPKKRGFFGRK